MNTKSKYKTRQKEELLEFLEKKPGVHITVGEVCDYFRAQGKTIGQTTVYRNLERMVDEGIVNKYVIDQNTPACFEYMSIDSHAGSGVCFHCKCERCGKLIHLSCSEMNELSEHLSTHHRFLLDPRRTVFYGVCEECMGQC